MKKITVDGFTHEFSNALVNATVVLTGVPSVKYKVQTKGICKHQFSATVSAITVPSVGATIPDPGPYTVQFSSTSNKVRDFNDHKFVLLEGDVTGDINATPQIPGSPPVAYPVTFHLRISNAGQVKGNAN